MEGTPVVYFPIILTGMGVVNDLWPLNIVDAIVYVYYNTII